MSVIVTTKAPFLSVIIRTKDEANRLRLTLASLQGQTAETEVIVVDDGSSDHTAVILGEAADHLPLEMVRHSVTKGRSAASNTGARHARGEVLLFLDGDTLAGPGLLSQHARLHAHSPHTVGRGDLHHLRCTRMFRDPECGTPWPERAGEIACRPLAEVDRMRVTCAQVLHEFDKIERRAEPGIYPGAGPRRLHELEMDALQNFPDCSVLWTASSGSNMSVRRADFLRSGGFNEMIDNNEHRELALRLVGQGARLIPVAGGRSYHLTHRSGWRDPLQDTAWEVEFLKAHSIPAVALLAVFWASLSPSTSIPPKYRINSLPELDLAARGDHGLDYDVARLSIKFVPLGTDFWRCTSGSRSATAGRRTGA